MSNPVDEPAVMLARRCLWIAYAWNDHDFSEAAHWYAKEAAKEVGIHSFDEANEWLSNVNGKRALAAPAGEPRAPAPDAAPVGLCATERDVSIESDLDMIRPLDGLFLGQLTIPELEALNRLTQAGLADREYGKVSFGPVLPQTGSAPDAAPAGEPADEREIERLRAFAAAVMEDWPDVGLDGADLQELGIKHGLLELKMPKPTEPCGENCNCAAYFAADEWAEGIECYRLTALVTAPRATDSALAPLKAANLSAALRAIVRECQDPKRFTSYLPPHLMDLAVAALESTETQEHETPLQVIEAIRRDEGVDDKFVANLSPRRLRILARDGDDIERAPSYEELRERRWGKRL